MVSGIFKLFFICLVFLLRITEMTCWCWRLSGSRVFINQKWSYWLFLLILCIFNIIDLVITYNYDTLVLELAYTHRTSKLICIPVHHIYILCVVSTSISVGLIYKRERLSKGAINIWQFRGTGNIGYTIWRKNKTNHFHKTWQCQVNQIDLCFYELTIRFVNFIAGIVF